MRLSILEDPCVRKSFEKRKEKYLVKKEGCWEWSGKTKNSSGYPLIRIGGRSGYGERVSRIMLYLDERPTKDGLYALHTCDNPGCVNPSHLYWGTAKDNIKDAIERGRFKSPPIMTREKTSRCYIKTQKDIDQLAEWCETLSIKEIAEKLGKKYNGTFRLLYRLGLKSKINMRGVGCKPPSKPSKFDDPETKKELILLSKEMTVKKLAKHFGVGKTTIYTQLKKLGITPVGKKQGQEVMEGG